MTNNEIRELKKGKIFTIPIKKLNNRYHIDANCNIIDTHNDIQNAIIYTWDPLTAMDPIEIILCNGEIRQISPANLYVYTYYGYLEADIYDMGYGHPSTRYRYIITNKEKMPDNTLIINNDLFKYSKTYNVYINQFGCAYSEFKILRHYIRDDYHFISGKTSTSYRVHRVVYDAWVSIVKNVNDIHHIDQLRWNNYYKNLRELSREEHLLVHGNNIYTDEVVYMVCELMSKGLRPVEAARVVGIPAEAAVRYRNGDRSEISSKFAYPNIPGFKLAKLNNEKVHEICHLFSTSNLSNKEIADIYSVDKYTIQDIRNRITWRNISINYIFESKDPGAKIVKAQIGNPRNASITEEDVIKIYKLLLEGHKICAVRDMTGISYNIIKKIKYKTRWASVTDKLDAELIHQHDEGSTTIESIA